MPAGTVLRPRTPNNCMRTIAGLVVLGLVGLIFLSYVRWAIRDATRRGKSRVLVVIAVVLLFPFGLLAWIIFRPPIGHNRAMG